MSCLVPGIQANPSTLYSPLVSGGCATLVSDASGIITGANACVNPPGLQAGLYAIMVHSSQSGYNISSIIYWNGTNWSSGGLAQNPVGTLQVYSASPFTAITVNNTAVGGVTIPGGVQLVPLSIGIIKGLP
jgi:hypothetical protein